MSSNKPGMMEAVLMASLAVTVVCISLYVLAFVGLVGYFLMSLFSR